MKVRFRNSVLFLLIKYAVFFFILAFIGDRFNIDKANTSMHVFKYTLVYIIYVLLYSSFLVALFSGPLYIVLRIKKGYLFLLGLASFLLFEYVGYTYLASQLNLTLGVYNLLVEVPLLWVFFHKAIKQKFVQYEAIE